MPDPSTAISPAVTAPARRTTDDIVIGMVGSGGDGVISSGELLVSAAAAEGLYATILKSFGPQIRGGESSCRVRISQDEALSYGDRLDVLVAFNWADFARFREELALAHGVLVIYDTKDGTAPEDIPVDPVLEPVVLQVPFHELATEATGSSLSKNILLLGVLGELLDLPTDGIAGAVDRKFRRKSEEVRAANSKALGAGRAYVLRELAEAPVPVSFAYEKGEPKLLMTGNEALAFGALKAGCRLYAGYPITPSSDVMEWLANELPRFGGTMMQTEDEIAAMGMCVGASFGATKAMTSTAGPGLSLMTEFLGLAAIAEIPVVIADIQRVGPSTGIPTKTEQCDFAHAAHAGPGDTPRVVVAPYDVADCFHMAVEAFNIAEEYQTPVLLLSDQYLGQRKESVVPFDIHGWPVVDRLTHGGNGAEPYRRYRLEDGDVSPMAIPGQAGGEHTISGLEHAETGDPTSSAALHARMNERRHAKLERLARVRGPDLVQRFGAESPELGIVCWGSTSAQAREAARRLNREGLAVGVCVPQLLCPLPVAPLQAFLDSVERALWVELNHQGQFHHWARARLDLDPAHRHLYARSGGMPFSVQEIVDQVLALREA